MEGATATWVTSHKRMASFVESSTGDAWELQGVLSSGERLLVIISSVFSNILTISAALALVSASAAMARATAWYSLSPALRNVFSCSLVGIPWRVRQARHFRLSDLCGLPQFLHLVWVIYLSSACIVDPQFPHEGALEQYLAKWWPLQQLQKSIDCFLL